MIRCFNPILGLVSALCVLLLIAAGCSSAGSKSRSAREEIRLAKGKLTEIDAQLKAKQVALIELKKDFDRDAIQDGPGERGFELPATTRLQRMLAEAKRFYEETDAMRAELEKKTSEEQLKTTSKTYPDPQMANLMEQLSQAEAKRKILLEDFPKDSPEVFRVSALVWNIKSQIDERTGGISMGLQAKVERAKARVDRLQEELERAETAANERTARARRYNEALHEIETLQQQRAALQLQIAEAQVGAARKR